MSRQGHPGSWWTGARTVLLVLVIGWPALDLLAVLTWGMILVPGLALAFVALAVLSGLLYELLGFALSVVAGVICWAGRGAWGSLRSLAG